VAFASSEIRELVALADRVVAMRRGAVSRTLERAALDERAVRDAIA
jgi:ABC-type sugar transport system ATPase subunit